MLGTATRISEVSGIPAFCTTHDEKEQKFIVFTSSICIIHGWGLGAGEGSRGRAVLMVASSASLNFHTTSRLSLPCLRSI